MEEDDDDDDEEDLAKQVAHMRASGKVLLDGVEYKVEPVSPPPQHYSTPSSYNVTPSSYGGSSRWDIIIFIAFHSLLKTNCFLCVQAFLSRWQRRLSEELAGRQLQDGAEAKLHDWVTESYTLS